MPRNEGCGKGKGLQRDALQAPVHANVSFIAHRACAEAEAAALLPLPFTRRGFRDLKLRPWPLALLDLPFGFVRDIKHPLSKEYPATVGRMRGF